MRCVEM